MIVPLYPNALTLQAPTHASSCTDSGISTRPDLPSNRAATNPQANACASDAQADA